jgi:F-type H+-transporting ATPase subunit delta
MAVSGGFATVQPDSSMSINAPEAYPLEDFSAEAIRAQIAEAQKIANGSGSEQDIAEAKIELEVYHSTPTLRVTVYFLTTAAGSRDSVCSCEISDAG